MTAPRIFTPEYYDRMRDLEADGWWNAGMRDAAELLLRTVRLPTEGHLIDVGCGLGQTMSWFLADHPGWQASGIDVARAGLQAACAAGLESVAEGSALSLPYPDGTFDLAITLDILQHLPLDGGDGVALAEMRRVLHPGGYLVVRTNAQAFPRTADDPAALFHKYEPHELCRKLERVGFTALKLSRINGLLGLAEIPRELREHRQQGDGYHGILSTPPSGGGSRLDAVKRFWLRLEGRAMSIGIRIPMGRTLLALCRAPAGDPEPRGSR